MVSAGIELNIFAFAQSPSSHDPWNHDERRDSEGIQSEVFVLQVHIRSVWHHTKFIFSSLSSNATSSTVLSGPFAPHDPHHALLETPV